MRRDSASGRGRAEHLAPVWRHAVPGGIKARWSGRSHRGADWPDRSRAAVDHIRNQGRRACAAYCATRRPALRTHPRACAQDARAYAATRLALIPHPAAEPSTVPSGSLRAPPAMITARSARAARESPSPAMTHRTRDRRACSPATSRSCSMTRRAERRCPDRCEPKDKPARGARHRSQDRPSGRRPTGCDPLDQAPRMAGTPRLAPGRFEARSAKPESTSSSHAGAVQSARGWRVVHATLGRRTPAMSSARIDVHRAGRIASLCASRSSKRSPLTPRTGAAVTAPRGARSARPAGGAAPA